MRFGELKVTIAFLLTAGVQIAWHRWLATGAGTAQTLLKYYSTYDAKVGKGVAGWFDLVIPCIVLGLIIGMVGVDWPLRKLSVVVLAVAAGLVALLPVYVFLLGGSGVWWWPTSTSARLMWFLQKAIVAVSLVGVPTYGARSFLVYLRAGNAAG
jgi:hypothetical protein